MSKPDFFLPFHLPMVLPDNDILNIGCDMSDTDRDLKQGFYRCRITHGVYQTMKCIFPKEDCRRMCCPVTTFSISLN